MFTSAFVDYPARFVAGVRGTLLVRAHTPLREVLPQFGQYLICVLPMCAGQPNHTLALTHFCYLVDVQVMPPLPPCTHLPWPCGQKPDPQEVFAHPPPQVDALSRVHRTVGWDCAQIGPGLNSTFKQLAGRADSPQVARECVSPTEQPYGLSGKVMVTSAS